MFLPLGKIYRGVVSEIQYSRKSAENISSQPYNLALKILNSTGSYHQILLSYSKVSALSSKNIPDSSGESTEYGTLYLFPDGVISGQDTTGIIDGRLRDKGRFIDLYYRSLDVTKNITSFYGTLTLE